MTPVGDEWRLIFIREFILNISLDEEDEEIPNSSQDTTILNDTGRDGSGNSKSALPE